MKTKFVLLALLLSSKIFAGEPLEWVGYMSSGQTRLFLLYDNRTKESSLWIGLGQTWHGYKPASFDPKAEELVVKTDALNFVLRLRDSKVSDLKSLSVVGDGSYPLVDGVVVYSSDAKLRLRGGLVSSPTGVMVSDSDRTIVSGDLLIERPDGTKVKVTNGVITSRGGKTVITGESISITVPPK